MLNLICSALSFLSSYWRSFLGRPYMCRRLDRLGSMASSGDESAKRAILKTASESRCRFERCRALVQLGRCGEMASAYLIQTLDEGKWFLSDNAARGLHELYRRSENKAELAEKIRDPLIRAVRKHHAGSTGAYSFDLLQELPYHPDILEVARFAASAEYSLCSHEAEQYLNR